MLAAPELDWVIETTLDSPAFQQIADSVVNSAALERIADDMANSPGVERLVARVLNDRRRALHDHLVDTVVIHDPERREPRPGSRIRRG